MTPLMSLVHDSIGKTSLIRANVDLIKMKLTNRGQLDEYLEERLNRILQAREDLDKIIDLYYTKAKEEGK